MSGDFDSTAFLLAGGQGTRLRDALPGLPKAMAPVGGRPFAEWLVLALRDQGIRRIVFCTGYRTEQIEAHFGQGRSWGLEISYSREQSPLGTAGALRLAASRVPCRSLLTCNADSYCPLDLDRLARAHARRPSSAILWLVPVEDRSRYGSVQIDGEGRVTAFVEKSAGQGPGLISAGIYLFDPAVLEAFPAKRPLSLETDVLPAFVGRGLDAVVGEGPFLDIGTPETYERAESFLATVGLR